MEAEEGVDFCLKQFVDNDGLRGETLLCASSGEVGNLHRECVGRDRMERFSTSPLDAQSNSCTCEAYHSFSISSTFPFGFSFLFPFLL